MILSGELNLLTAPTEKLVEVGEALVVAMEQRKALLRKRFRKYGKVSLSEFELNLIGEGHDLGTDFNEVLSLESRRHDEQLQSDFAAMNAADNVGSETLKLLDIPAER